jgi:hypothetical protein
LAVGNNGESLVADSVASTGLRYTAGTVQANPVLNSSYQVWQRGTANVTTASAYTADRWQKGSATFYGISRQVTGDTTNLPNIQYCARIQRTAGSTTTTGMEFYQSFETVNSIPYAGKTVTISYYARKGANWSSLTSSLGVQVYTGTGTDQNLVSYTGSTLAVDAGAVITSTWARYSATGTISASATEMGVYVIATPNGTAGANDYVEITGVQIDIGSVALPFRTYAATIQGELAACQRYYWRTGGSSAYEAFWRGVGRSTTQADFYLKLPVTMRVAPTAVESSTLAVENYPGGSSAAVTALSLIGNQGSKDTPGIILTVASGLTAGTNYTLYASNSTSAYLAFSAEL